MYHFSFFLLAYLDCVRVARIDSCQLPTIESEREGEMRKRERERKREEKGRRKQGREVKRKKIPRAL